VDAAKYGGIVNGFRVSVREGGMMELTKGWAPTLIGYSMQGLCKFGFYEVFKNIYAGMLGEVRAEQCIQLSDCYNILLDGA
jgi:solute carrier family 25 phosphate transporter 3